MNDDLLVDWESLPLLPEGLYEAVYVNHETIHKSFGPKVKITFRVTTFGPFHGTLISGWYNAKSLNSKPGKGRSVTLSRHSKLVSELLKVLDVKTRVNRLSPAQLKSTLLEIKIRTVKSNSKQKELHSCQQYSVVDSIVRGLTSNRFEPPQIKPLPLPVPIPEPAPT